MQTNIVSQKINALQTDNLEIETQISNLGKIS